MQLVFFQQLTFRPGVELHCTPLAGAFEQKMLLLDTIEKFAQVVYA